MNEDVQALFDAANARVDAGTFDEAAWRTLCADVGSACADLDAEAAGVFMSAAVQMGATAGFDVGDGGDVTGPGA